MKSVAQFNAIDYDFTGSAQVLQTNPGTNYIYKGLIGIPLLTHSGIFAGSTGFSPYDLFATESSFETKVDNVLQNLKNTDFVLFNYRQDLFTFGWSNDPAYFNYLGMYWEMDHITYLPADLLRLAKDGNALHLYEVYDAKYLASNTELIQTLYFGRNIKKTSQFTYGYRFNLYFGAANAKSTGNSGKFYTTTGENNYYTHHLENINISARTAGYNENGDTGYYLSKLFLSGNMGLGTDWGLTFQSSKRFSLSAALLNIGFIYYNKDIHNYNYSGSYNYEGAQIEFPENSYIDYWKEIKDGFNNKIPKTENSDAYIVWRPLTFYTGLKYGLGNLNKQDCEHFVNPVDEYKSFIGLSGFAQVRPVKLHLGGTVFYEQKWSKYLYTKLNLTADNFSYYALGGGMVINLGRLQFSLTADNLLGLSDLSKSRKQSFHFGLNWIKF